MTAMGALTLEGLRHRFGTTLAVDGLDLSIEPGELVCLLGPSGCGKTTALRLAAGLERLQEGRVLIGGQLVADARHDTPPEGRSVGLMFQDFALFPHLSVADNVAFGLRRRPAGERRAEALKRLEQVGLAALADLYPHTLSGGQQQRVALARALAPQPGVMLLDEPFSGLDVTLRRSLRDDTLHLLKASGAATLMVTHDPEEAMTMADRIAVMRAGRLEQVGDPTTLYCRPVSRFVASFFGEINVLGGKVTAGVIDTALGPIAAPGLPEGSLGDIIVRTEAIKLRPSMPLDGACCRARVVAARLLGRTSLVHLEVSQPGAPLHLHARIAGRNFPAEGSDVVLSLDSELAFVFPASGTT